MPKYFTPLRHAAVRLCRARDPPGALLVVVLTGWGGLPGFLVALWFATALVFILNPNATALALEDYGHMTGTAAAFLGAANALLAGLISPLVGVLGGDRYAMVYVMTGAAVAALLVLLLATPVFRRGIPRRVTGPSVEQID